MTQTTEAAVSTTLIEDLDQLTAITEAPLHCTFRLDGKAITIPCRRLSPVVDEKVRALRRAAQPPFKKEQNNYDYLDAGYQTKKADNEKVARSLIVYTGCPMVAAKKPGLTDAQEIHAFLRGILPEMMLELLAATITASGLEVDVTERANFTYTSASES